MADSIGDWRWIAAIVAGVSLVTSLLAFFLTRVRDKLKARVAGQALARIQEQRRASLQYTVGVDAGNVQEQLDQLNEQLRAMGMPVPEIGNPMEGMAERMAGADVNVQVNATTTMDVDGLDPETIHVLRAYPDIPDGRLLWVSENIFVRRRGPITEMIQVSPDEPFEEETPSEELVQELEAVVRRLKALRDAGRRRTEEPQPRTAWERLRGDP